MTFQSVVTLSLGAILIENFVLVRFLGICPFLGVSKKTDTAFGMSMAVIFVMTAASAATWAVERFLLTPFELGYMRTVAFILVIAAFVQFVEMVMKKFIPALYSALGIYLPLITTNCAVLGAAIINIDNEYTLINAVVYGAFSAVGFTMAIMIFAGVRERVAFAEPPEAFRGIPVTLVAAGLLAMAFAGFQGASII